MREVRGRLSQVLKSALQALPGKGVVAILFCTPTQELPADLIQLFLHLPITGEVHALELVNEPDQAIEGALVEEQLDQVRREFLSRSAEEYRDDAFARERLQSGLQELAKTATDLAHQDSRDLVGQFGKMGQRRFHLAA